MLDRPLPPAPPPGDGCAGCHAPASRPARRGAVRRAGFDVAACHARRLVAEPCHLSCAARIACVRGPEHRYRDEQLAFHMRASMPASSRMRLDGAPPGSYPRAPMAITVNAHITGTVWKINVKVGDTVAEGETVAILESMKMEMPVESPAAGKVSAVLAKEGGSIEEGAPLLELAPV